MSKIERIALIVAGAGLGAWVLPKSLWVTAFVVGAVVALASYLYQRFGL